jgi:Cys-tRNA(Pro)/Cys-tRNA(Cys) deacylase
MLTDLAAAHGPSVDHDGWVAGKGTPAITAARRAGIAVEVHELPGGVASERTSDGGYGLAAARGLGVEAARVFKTLVVDVDNRLVVAIVPVDRSLDLKALAVALAAKRAVMAQADDAERATGYVVGGISPLGQRRRLPTVLDDSANDHQTIFVSAGRRGLELEVSPADLVAVTGATVASISL